MTSFIIPGIAHPSIRSVTSPMEETKQDIENMLFNTQNYFWKKAVSLITDKFNSLDEKTKTEYQKFFSAIISKKTTLLVNDLLTADTYTRSKKSVDLAEWHDFLRTMTVSSAPQSPQHIAGIQCLKDILNVTNKRRLVSEPIEEYRYEDGDVVGHLFKLFNKNGVSRTNDMISWIVNVRGSNDGMKEDVWSSRLEQIAEKVCVASKHSSEHLLLKVWELVDKNAKEGKFSDTDWPLRIAMRIHDDAVQNIKTMDFDKITAIRNACPSNPETDDLFMTAALRFSILVERVEGDRREPLDGPYSPVLTLSNGNIPYAAAGIRKFSPIKTAATPESLWEITLKQLGASETVIDSFRIATTTMSIDFTELENRNLAVMLMKNNGHIIGAETEVDLTDFVNMA